MKYLVILGDGMADYYIEQIKGTPLSVARKPMADALAKRGTIGLVKTVPEGFKPGSDTANLSVMGYEPQKYYTGRSPLEAYSLGIKMDDDDLALRCNLLTLSDEDNYADKTMIDYSAGEITPEEAAELMEAVKSAFNSDTMTFYTGFSYRHCLIIKHGVAGTSLTPPHDITGKKIADYLPKGVYGDTFVGMYKKSAALLKDHPVNVSRRKRGLNTANSIWLWGEGRRPALDSFKSKFGKTGGVISAVDLLKGIGKAAMMEVPDVKGATGTIDTDYAAKVSAALKVLDGNDFCYVHIEAPDECGHQGDLQSKIKAIELLDEKVLTPLYNALKQKGEPFRILFLPDHPTPVSVRTHVSDPVPYLMYQSDKVLGSFDGFDEEKAAASGNRYDSAPLLMKDFLK